MTKQTDRQTNGQTDGNTHNAIPCGRVGPLWRYRHSYGRSRNISLNMTS